SQDSLSTTAAVTALAERQIGWPSLLESLAVNNGELRERLELLKMEEELFMMRFVRGLAMNPMIEGDHHLFVSHRYQANALEPKTISDCWALTDTIASIGTSIAGYQFQKAAFDGRSEKLTDASSSLMSWLIDYVVSRSNSPWRVFEQAALTVELVS